MNELFLSAMGYLQPMTSMTHREDEDVVGAVLKGLTTLSIAT